MTRKFYFHPDRRKDVGDALIAGTLVATSEQLVEDWLMSTETSTGVPVLGFWVDCIDSADFHGWVPDTSKWDFGAAGSYGGYQPPC